jgi:dihydrolipoamide dehydrogenase
MHTQVLVLGGGPGGYAAAFFAADLGMEVTIVDKVGKLGGTCLLRGCIPSKALLHVAKVINESTEMNEWGVKFQKPVIDLQAMRARKQQIIDTLSGGLGTLAKKRNVKVVIGNGYFESSNRLRVEGGDPSTHPSTGCISFDTCILATGSEPAMPGMFQIGSNRIMDSTGALELTDIPEKLLVVGAGYIGLEMGTVYASLGSKVKVVEMMDTFLPTTDADLARQLKKRLDHLFESIELGTKVAGVEAKDDKVIATFEKGDQTYTEGFDRVLVCIGRRPNSHGIGLENTKVVVNDRGFVQTDNQQKTDDPAIYAIGDVIGNPMLAHKASYEGKIAVEVIKGQNSTFDAQAIPAVVFTDPELAWAGITEREAKEQGIEVEIAVYPWGASGRAQAMGRPDGLTKMIIEPGTDRVLGVGIVGAGAGELIGEATLAIEMGAVVHDMTECIHPHPTMSETLPHAGDAHHGVATEIYRPRRPKK